VVAMPCGRAQVVWQHEGIRHMAELRLDGPQGFVRVSLLNSFGGEHQVDQDLRLLRTPGLVSYVGSSPRTAGTTLPEAGYAPDVFRLERLSSRSWRVKDVSDVSLTGHWDTAVPGPYSAGMSLTDCR
jgi:hypothetical protein